MFRRIKNLLTPPPSQAIPPATSTPPPSDAREEESRFNHELRQSLEALITAPQLNSPPASQAVATLKELAKGRGPYVTAARIRMHLEARRTDTNAQVDPGRGFVLAADFILQHMMREIAAIEHKSVGPNIFKAYCNDLVDCLSRGRKVRRCIEVPIMTFDRLLGKALTTAKYKNVHTEMARQVILATEEVAAERIERDERTLRQQMREQRSASTPLPVTPDPAVMIDRKCITYLNGLHAAIERIKEDLSNYNEAPAIAEEAIAAGAFDPNALGAHRSYLAGLLPLAESAGYPPFRAMVTARLANLMAHNDPSSSERFHIETAASYESQGDQEVALHLYKLGGARFAQSTDHYRRGGDITRSDAAQAKKLAAEANA